MSAACRERSLPLRAAWLQLPVTRTAHHSEDVTYKQVTGYIQCITLNHDPGLNPVDVEVFWTGYWDDNLPDTGPDTGYPLKPDGEIYQRYNLLQLGHLPSYFNVSTFPPPIPPSLLN